MKWKRFERSRTGFLVPYQCLEVILVRLIVRGTRYVPIPEFWGLFECPCGMIIEIPWAVTYIRSLLVDDPMSGLWAVVLTEWVSKYSAFLLWDSYETYRTVFGTCQHPAVNSFLSSIYSMCWVPTSNSASCDILLAWWMVLIRPRSPCIRLIRGIFVIMCPWSYR